MKTGADQKMLAGLRVALPSEPLVHKEFEARVSSTPDAVAVTCGDRALTYAELNDTANRFAHYLGSQGICRGALVGVCLDYGPELLATILGILKSGAAYVPLDPSYPAGRLRLMLAQLPGLELVAVTPGTFDLVRESGRRMVDVSYLDTLLEGQPTSNPASDVTSDDLCYAVFTSGSTGSPKVTAVRHEGWYNLLNWLALEYGLNDESSNLVVSAFGFDITQRSLLTALFAGATQHLLPTRHFDTAMAYRHIAELEVRTLHCAPSTLYLLVDWEMATGGNALTQLDYVFIGGEALSIARVAEWAQRDGNKCRLLHQYGVAECTDVASSHVLTDYAEYLRGVVPVGKPVYNTEIRILDEDLDDVATGETGEICISGLSVGCGYLNGSAAESARFSSIVRDGQMIRLYRTGDRGYLTPSGELVVAGRMDAQVKVRGMRIDVADVERAIAGIATVRDAAVVPRKAADGDLELIAFLIPANGEIDMRALRGNLLKVLPRNMVPSEFIEVSDFPLNPNGKVDRKVLAGRALVPVGGQ